MKKTILNSIVVAAILMSSIGVSATNIPLEKGKTYSFYNPRTVVTNPYGMIAIVCGNYQPVLCATIKGITDNSITVETFNENGSIDVTYTALNVTLDVNASNQATITIIPD